MTIDTERCTSGTSTISEPEVVGWERDSYVFWYRLWIGKADYQHTGYYDWIKVEDACDETTCTLDVSSANFPDGDYEVWAEMWGPGGYITWPDSPNAVFRVVPPDSSVPSSSASSRE